MACLRSVLCLLLVATWAPAAAAANLRIEAPLVAVELYPTGARLTRQAEVELPAGRQRLELRGLPANLTPGAVDVLIEPPTLAWITAIDLRQRIASGPVHAREQELRAEIERLSRERHYQRDRIEAARMQLKCLSRLAELFGAQAGGGIVGGQPAPENWRRAWETVGAGALEIFATIREAEAEVRALERQIEARERELAAIATGAREEGVLEVELEVPAAGRLRLTLRYEHPDAGFRPVYEAHLDAARSEVIIRQRAIVHQRTGEDWTGVRLSLASVRREGPIAPPQPEPWFIDVREPEVIPFAREDAGGAMSAPAIRAKGLVADQLPFAVRYSLPDPMDLPADGRERVLDLGASRFAAKLVVTSFPALDPQSYIVARFTYEHGLPLLPGELRLFRDGVAAGRDYLPATAPGTSLNFGFGRDERVAVERRRYDSLRSEEGIFDAYRRIERRFITRIRNGHERPIEVKLLDRMPVPQDERIRVELTRDTTPPQEFDRDGRRGVVAWKRTLNAGEEFEIRFGFAVTFPKDVEINGLD